MQARRSTLFRTLLLLRTACLLALISPAFAQEVVRAGGEADYAPYTYRDADGNAVGFHVELLRAVAREAGFEVRYQLGPWEEQVAGIESGEIDVLDMFVSRRRAERVNFADPHLIVSHRVFVPTGSEPVETLADLGGRTVVVQAGAYSQEYLSYAGIPARLVRVADEREAVRRLVREGHDAALLTEHRARRVLEEEGLTDEVVSGPPVLPVDYAFAVPEGRDALLARIDEGLDRVRDSGEFDRLYARWLAPLDAGAAAGAGSAWRAIAAGAALALALAGVGAWMLRTRRMGAAERAAREELAFARRHDPLTGLLNRRAFEDELDAVVAGADDSDRSHVLATFDLDQFRLLNELHGMARADRALRAVARLTEAASRPGDRATRWGSDEFAWLLADVGTAEARERCEALLASMRQLDLEDGDERVALTASLGFVTVTGGETDGATAIRRADAAALAAKEEGGDRVREWREDDSRTAERSGALRWVHALQAALDEDRLELFGQILAPADPAAMQAPAMEFLVRLRTQDGEIVPAGRFMPAAERYGLARRVDAWVVEGVLAWLQRHPEARRLLARVNVNLSGRSLGDPAFMASLEDTLARSAELLPFLCFEITESALVENLDTAQDALWRLRERGCRFALDDFGRGHSSMRYLKHLPVDYLKIDGSFVRDVAHDAQAAKLVGDIHRLARTMGLRTVAEFVETSEVRGLLQRMGIDEVQGYGIGRPAPVDDVLRSREAETARVS